MRFGNRGHRLRCPNFLIPTMRCTCMSDLNYDPDVHFIVPSGCPDWHEDCDSHHFNLYEVYCVCLFKYLWNLGTSFILLT